MAEEIVHCYHGVDAKNEMVDLPCHAQPHP